MQVSGIDGADKFDPQDVFDCESVDGALAILAGDIKTAMKVGANGPRIPCPSQLPIPIDLIASSLMCVVCGLQGGGAAQRFIAVNNGTTSRPDGIHWCPLVYEIMPERVALGDVHMR